MFKINKDTKIYTYKIPEAHLELIKGCFNKKNNHWDEDVMLSSSYFKRIKRNNDHLLKLYNDILLYTGSIPFKNHNKVDSYPGNYGSSILNMATYNVDEIINTWKTTKNEYDEPIPQELIKFYNQIIHTIVDRLRAGVSIKLLVDDKDEYLNKKISKNLIIIPFELSLTKNNKSLKIKCSISMDSVRDCYMNYCINYPEPKRFHWSQEFIEEINNRLK